MLLAYDQFVKVERRQFKGDAHRRCPITTRIKGLGFETSSFDRSFNWFSN